jgi:putative tryptophan/tyrosine transport system substrate-binding protein
MIVWLMGCISFQNRALAQPRFMGVELRVLANEPTKSSEILVRALERLPNAKIVSSSSELVGSSGSILTIAVGGQSARSACVSSNEFPVLVVSTTRLEYEKIRLSCNKKMVSAIFAETSPRTQFELAKLLYGEDAKAVILLSQSTRNQESLLRSAAKQIGMSLRVLSVESEENATRVIASATDVEVVMAMPDPTIYNANTLRTLLESTYRRNIGMIGFTPSSVEAGMIGATFATPNDVADHVEELVRNLRYPIQLPGESYPKYWRSAVNESVAKSMSIKVSSAAFSFRHTPTEAIK